MFSTRIPRVGPGRMKLRSAFLGVLAALTIAGQGFADTPMAPGARPITARYHDKRIIGQAASLEAAEAIAREHGLRVLKTFEALSEERGHWYGVWEVAEQRSLAVEDVVAKLKSLRSAGVMQANLDYIVSAAAVPNDPSFSKQWALKNTGQNNGTVGCDSKASEAWDIETGSENVVVAIVDSGISYNHPDLAPNIWINKDEIAGNGKDDDANGYVDDVYGINAITGSGDPADDFNHGSHCAGIVGAAGNNGAGITGINWKVKLMGLKFLNGAGSGAESDAMECMNYIIALAKKGVKIVAANHSYTGPDRHQGLLDAMETAGALGVLNFIAAGNDTKDIESSPTYPAVNDLKYAITVGNSNNTDGVTFNSNWGAKNVDLFAPGYGILSCDKGSGYMEMSGTSMAAPLVAGASALAYARFPDETPDQRVGRLLANVDKVAAFSGKCVSGGRLNALKMVQGGDYLNPMFEFTSALDSLTVSFKDTSISSSGSISSWSWDFGDGQTSTVQNPTHTFAAAGKYTVTLTVTDPKGLKDKASQVVTVPKGLVYCSASSQDGAWAHISEVKIGSFTRTSGTGTYTLYDAEKVQLKPGETYTVTVTGKTNPFGWAQYLRMWIDYNRDQDFEDAGEMVFEQSGSTSFTGSFTVPTSAVTNKDLGIRFYFRDSSYPTSCGSGGWGEVEDYRAVVNGTSTPTAPSITTQPKSISVNKGQTATFSVVASGTAPLSYQWYKGTGAISGATSASYTTPATTMADNNTTFYVKVSNSVGSVNSQTATLTVTDTADVIPAITTQPADARVEVGQTATFSVVATGTPAPTYQWKKNGNDIVGATSASYTTPATALTDNAAKFSVVVTNRAGSVTSREALLTVNEPPSDVNLALNKTTSASSTYTGRPSSYAVDGSTTTRWSSASLTSLNRTQWLSVDLGARSSVSRAKVLWGTTYYANAWSVQYLNASGSWVTVWSTTNATSGGWKEVTFPAVTATRWRIQMTQNAGSNYTVYELQLFAK